MSIERVNMESLTVGTVVLAHQTGNFNQRDEIVSIEEANLGRRITMRNTYTGRETFWYAFSGDHAFIEGN